MLFTAGVLNTNGYIKRKPNAENSGLGKEGMASSCLPFVKRELDNPQHTDICKDTKAVGKKIKQLYAFFVFLRCKDIQNGMIKKRDSGN